MIANRKSVPTGNGRTQRKCRVSVTFLTVILNWKVRVLQSKYPHFMQVQVQLWLREDGGG